jgi:hypothetical protein
MRTLVGRALDFWFAPVHAARVDLFARGFVLTFALFVAGWGLFAREWLSPLGFHISPTASNPLAPTPAPLLPEVLAVPFVALVLLLSLAALLTKRQRLWFFLLAPLALYLQLVDFLTAFTLNKFYVVFFVLLALRPRRQSFSPGHVEMESAWALRSMQATLLISYGTAGICKIAHGDWLSRPDVLFTHLVGVFRTDAAAWFVHTAPSWLLIAFAWSALLFELLAPLLFGVRRLRWVAYLWGAGFHLSVALFMKDLIYFSLQMMSMYLLFIAPPTAVRIEEAFARTRQHGWARLSALVRARRAVSSNHSISG